MLILMWNGGCMGGEGEGGEGEGEGEGDALSVNFYTLV